MNVGNSRALLVPFGEKDLRFFAPDQVPKGLECGCVCPGCGGRLVANHPKNRTRRRAYFSHYATQDCLGGFESALHKMAIQIIFDARWITVPERHFDIKTHIAGNYYESRTITLPSRSVPFASVVAEKNAIMKLRPDLTATLEGGTTLFIEIAVTHEVNKPKAEALDNLMEIDLSGIDRELAYDLETLREIVLISACREWFRCSMRDRELEESPQYQEWLEWVELATTRYFQQREQEAQESERRERLRLQEESRRTAVRAKTRKPHLEDLSKVLKMTEPGMIDRYDQWIWDRCQAVIAETQRRVESLIYTRSGVTVHGAGLQVDGHWIVRTHPLVWQTFVLQKFIFQNNLQGTFTVAKVVDALERQFGFLPWIKRLSEVKRHENRAQFRLKHRILTDEETRAINLPEDVVKNYLNRLSAAPYSYLQNLKGRDSYVVCYRQPLELQKIYRAKSNQVTDR